MSEQEKENPPKKIPGQLPVNQETLDILVANIIPTSRYFEVRFDHLEDRFKQMQSDLIHVQDDVTGFRSEVSKQFDSMNVGIDRRFDYMKADVDRRFEQVDRRFEQVDQRFEQVDKRFEQMINSLDNLTNKLDHRDEGQRSFTLRMFTISITISILGVTGAFLKAFSII